MPQPTISKATPPDSLVPSFSRNITISRSGSTKWQMKRQLPPYSFRISLKDISSHISRVLLNFHPNLDIPPWTGNISKFVVIRLLKKCICGLANWKWTFLLIPSRQNFPPALYHYPLRQRKFSNRSVFFQNLFSYSVERARGVKGSARSVILSL